eukprot:3221959-Pleurochrysis_carterae.AAC.3
MTPASSERGHFLPVELLTERTEQAVVRADGVGGMVPRAEAGGSIGSSTPQIRACAPDGSSDTMRIRTRRQPRDVERGWERWSSGYGT